MKTAVPRFIVAGLVLMLVACGDEQEEATNTPTETAIATAKSTATTSPAASLSSTSSPNTETGGFEGFRLFARQIEAAIEAREPAFFIGRAKIVEKTCTGDEQLGRCGGEPAGTVIRGIPGAAWKSDASWIFSVEEYEEYLARYFADAIAGTSDEYGSGDLIMYALARRSGGNLATFAALATSIVDTYPTGYPIGRNEREVHVFNFVLEEDDRWSFAGETVANASASSAEWLSGTCVLCYDDWERWGGSSP